MNAFFFNYGRFFLLAFAVGFLFPRLSSGNVLSSSTDYDKYAALDTLNEMIETFHVDMNATTNEYIEGLLSTPTPNVLYPASDEDCTADNYSTYCLAVVLNAKLTGFEQALTERKNTLEELDDLVSDEESESPDQLDTLSDAIQFANQQALVVDEQMQNAEDALDLTLAVYNQIQIVYPLHVELTDFRKNLEGFRDNLAAVRDVIEGYPSKFNGASTAQCK